MGAQASKNRGRPHWSSLSAPLELIDRSQANDNDLIANLRWSLTEAMRWDERAVAVKDIVCVEGSADAKNLSKSQQEERYQATLELLDNVLLHDTSQTKTSPSASSATKAKESVKSLFTTKSSEQGAQQRERGTSGGASTGSPTTSKSPPSSAVQGYATTLLPPSSSKLFAVAACKFVLASISQGSLTGERSSWLGGESRSKVSEAMSSIQKTIASQTGGISGVSGGGISGGTSMGQSNVLPSESMKGTESGGIKSVVGSSFTAFPHDEIVEEYHGESMNERVELACKYIYLSSLMKSLSHSTAWCYQLHEKIKWFNNCISDLSAAITKGNRQQYTNAEFHKKQMELAKDRVYLLLQDGLKTHDRFRCVLRLLYRDFELCLARHKLQAECARWAYARDQQKRATGAAWTTDELEGKINTLNAQKQALDLEVEKNERDALSCGLAFLDKNLSGSLEAEESPELNAKLFRMLDLQHRAAISYTDLHQGVLSIQEKLENITARIQLLQQQNEQLRQRSTYTSYQSTAASGIASGAADPAVIVQNETEIEQLKRASVEHWNNLQQIYSAFFNAFAQSVFPSVELNEIDSVQSQALANGDSIVQIVDHISKISVTDPLIMMQTKLQRGDVSLTSQASLDAALIAQSQQIPVPAALEAAQTAPLTIPMALATTPAAQHRPPSTFDQTTKPKSAVETIAAERGVDASKRELGRQQQMAEHPSGAAAIEEHLPGVKDVHGNIEASREYAREKAAEMRTSQMEHAPKRSDTATEDRTKLVPETLHVHQEPKKESSREWGTQTETEHGQTPTISRQTPLIQTRTAGTDYQQQSSSMQQPSTTGQSWTEKVSSTFKSALPASLGGTSSAERSTSAPAGVEEYQQKDVPQKEAKYQTGQQWASGGGVGERQSSAGDGGEENLSGRDYVEKPSYGMGSEERNIPYAPAAPTGRDYDEYQRSISQAPSGYGEYQQPSTAQTQRTPYEKQIGYGAQGGVTGGQQGGGGQQEEEYFTPAPIGTEKNIAGGYSQQKHTQFAADPSSITSSTERSDIPQSPERQSQSWTESIKNTVRSVTGAGSHTSTH